MCSGVKVLTVGGGERASALRQLVQGLNLSGTVFFAGRDEVVDSLAALDLLAMPSLGEGLPHVCLEAVASGTPVVAFDAQGTNEAVIHDQTGLLLPKGNTDALAEALKRLLSDRGLYDRLVARCHTRRRLIGIEEHVRNLEDLAVLRDWRPSIARAA